MNLCILKPGSIIPTSIVLFFGYCKIVHINNVMNFTLPSIIHSELLVMVHSISIMRVSEKQQQNEHYFF
jgi:hypothetical protein